MMNSEVYEFPAYHLKSPLAILRGILALIFSVGGALILIMNPGNIFQIFFCILLLFVLRFYLSITRWVTISITENYIESRSIYRQKRLQISDIRSFGVYEVSDHGFAITVDEKTIRDHPYQSDYIIFVSTNPGASTYRDTYKKGILFQYRREVYLMLKEKFQ